MTTFDILIAVAITAIRIVVIALLMFGGPAVLYAVTFEGVRIGSAELRPRSPQRTRWIARLADSNELRGFPTRREASAWLVARYREQREREA